LKTGAAAVGEIVTGGKIYPDASPDHSVGVTLGGEVEEYGHKSGGPHVMRYIR
jgi:hypothetical protein